MKTDTAWKFLRMLLGAMLFMMGSAWTADYIREWLFLGAAVDGRPPWVPVAISILVWLAGGWWIFLEGRRLISFSSRLQSDDVKPHRALVLLVSSPSSQDIHEKSLREVQGKSLSEAIASIEGKDDLRKWNWLMVLRAIACHMPVIDQVMLIGSKGGSERDLDVCRQMIEAFAGLAITVKPWHVSPDFENLDEMQRTGRNIVNGLIKDYPESEIIFDITGGTKTASIGLALASVEFKDVEFQYFSQRDSRHVAYNVVGFHDPILGGQ